MGALFRRLAPLLAAAGLLAACERSGGGTEVAADEMSMGSADAPVTVVEYASVTCSACAMFNEEVFPAFKAKYIDTEQVRYVMREFLTAPPQVSAAGFLIARCAGPDKYFGVVDALFRSQQEMFQGDTRAVLFRIGASAGLSNEQVTACIADEEALEALNRRVDTAANVANVQATPTFIIGDKKLEGVQSLAELDAVIQPLLRR